MQEEEPEDLQVEGVSRSVSCRREGGFHVMSRHMADG